MKNFQMTDVSRYAGMTTAQLRECFLQDDLFQTGTVQNLHLELGRTVIGSAVPLHQPRAPILNYAQISLHGGGNWAC